MMGGGIGINSGGGTHSGRFNRDLIGDGESSVQQDHQHYNSANVMSAHFPSIGGSD